MPYPVNYNGALGEYKIVHDRYALVKVILHKVKGIEESKKKQLRTLGNNEAPCLMTFVTRSVKTNHVHAQKSPHFFNFAVS